MRTVGNTKPGSEIATLSPRIPGVEARYGLAIVSVVFTLGVGLLARHYGIGHQFAVLLFAVAVAGWNGGLGPAIVAAVLSSLAYDYFITEPIYRFGFTKYDVIDLTLYVSFAFLITRFRDVRWRTEGKLRASEKKYRGLIDSSPDAIFVWDEAGRCVLANASAVRLFGCTEDELTTLSAADTYITDERARLHERNQRAREAGVVRYERQFLRKNKEIIPVEVSLSTAGERLYQSIVRDITDRKEAEEELRKQAELLSLAHDAIIVRDPLNRVIFWNRGAERTYGWTGAEAFGKITHELLQTRFPVSPQAIAIALQEHGQWEGELTHVTRDGETIVVASRQSLRRGEHGSPTVILEINRDVTESKRAEEALREAEKRYRDLVNSVDGIVWEADATTFVFSFVSEQAERILGYPTERWLKEPSFWKDHLHPEDRNWAVQFCAKATAEKRNHDFEYRMIRADGRTVWFHDIVTVVVEGDRPTTLRGVMVDTTARKRAEQSVRRSEEQLRDLIQTIPAMAFVTRPDGSNEFVSRQWIEFSGLSQEETSGGGWAATLHPEDSEQHVAKWNAALATGQPFESVARHRDANGNYRWLLIRAVPSRDDEDNILKWYGALTDIEDRKRAEALLAGENRILEMVAKGDSLAEILNSLCRLVEEQASEVLASILLVEGGHLWHGGAPDLPEAYTQAIDGTAIGPIAGSCGAAAYTGKQVIVEDIATDPLWIDYRGIALPHSLRACWSTPIFSTEGKVIGTFAMYYREPRRPTERDQQIIGQITHLAGIAIERKLTQDKLSLSERNLTEAQKLTHTGSFVWDILSKKALYLSDEWYRIYGFEIGEAGAWEERVNRLGPEETKQWEEAVARAIQDKSDYELEKRLVLPDGTTKYLHAIGHPVLNSSSEVVQFIGSVTDITERKRSEALLTGEKQLLEMIATGVPLKEILNALCRIIEEQRPGTLASVLLMNRDGIHLNVAAGPTLPRAWSRRMELLPIGPCAGSCGTAAYRGSSVIVSDIANDPLWDVPEHRAAALKHGLRASWSNPVLSWKGEVLGTFCMYYREPRSPISEDLELIELATHLVRVAMERDRAQEALRVSERVARSHVEVMMRSLDVLATEAAPEKFIAEMLRTIGQHLRALRVLLFLRNPQDDTVRIHLVIEDDRQVAMDSDHPFANDACAWKKRPLFQELLFTKSPVVVDDIEGDARLEPEFREYLRRNRCQRFMAVPMFVSGELRGFIGIHHSEKGFYRADEIELAQALAHHVMLAVHGQELVEQQREAAILKERTRMARDIHDTLAQGFTGVIVQMEAAEEALLDDDMKHAVGHVRRARELARDSLGEARRSVHALRPQALEKAAFADALQAIIKNTAAGTVLLTEFRINGNPRELAPAVEENLLHIGQEALTNALKHAHATKFDARLNFDSDAVYLELRDNGVGFVIDGMNDEGIGLIGMKERADHIGATLEVRSEPGKGTKITAVSPYQNA